VPRLDASAFRRAIEQVEDAFADRWPSLAGIG
jgi:hypothetical protein